VSKRNTADGILSKTVKIKTSMFSKLIHRLLLRRHFWRYATFSEVAELYASRMMRMLAINMSAAFIAVYLYQIGYSVLFIACYWVGFFAFKSLMSLPAAKYAATFGPKHGILLSNLLYIPAMIIFAFAPRWGIPAIIAAGMLQGFSATLYDLCHLIDFSKVKNADHAGKEIAYMNIVEKIATGLSPLAGGVLAFLAGPQATMVAAALLFALASVPLFKSAEPVPSRQRLVFKGFPWRMAWRSLVAEMAIGFDGLASGSVWSLFVAVTILGVAANNQVYAQLGGLLSVILLAALAASYVYGLLIDRQKGKELLRVAAIGDALTHAARPFITTVPGIMLINIANEAATTGYAMAFTRGMFDTADLSGHRITYLGCIELALNAGAVLSGLSILLFISAFNGIAGMRWYFIVVAIVVVLIATPRFRLYQK
jgi:MFS family permease